MADKAPPATDTLTELLRRESEQLRRSKDWRRSEPSGAGDVEAAGEPAAAELETPPGDAIDFDAMIVASDWTVTEGDAAESQDEIATSEAEPVAVEAAGEAAEPTMMPATLAPLQIAPPARPAQPAPPAATAGASAARTTFPPKPNIRIRQPLAERVVEKPVEEPVVENAAIDIQHLGLTYLTNDGPVEALSGIDLKIHRGEFISLIGPSGCGKTTLLRVIADLERATAGTILVNGMSPEQARLNRDYGYVFQAPALYPWRTIAKNVALPLEIMGLPAAERQRRIKANLEMVNLTGFERKFPWQLSGGMQQRASIARALAVEPELLLMDEPFGALDEIVRDHLNEQLLNLWSKTDKTVIFVTHSIPEAVFLSTRIVVMTPRPGKIHDIIESTLPRDRNLDIRETPEFLKIAHRVRQGLRAGHSYDD